MEKKYFQRYICLLKQCNFVLGSLKNSPLKFKVNVNSATGVLYTYFHQLEGVEFIYDSHKLFLPTLYIHSVLKEKKLASRDTRYTEELVREKQPSQICSQFVRSFTLEHV